VYAISQGDSTMSRILLFLVATLVFVFMAGVVFIFTAVVMLFVNMARDIANTAYSAVRTEARIIHLCQDVDAIKKTLPKSENDETESE
jgi:hypothetical protein